MDRMMSHEEIREDYIRRAEARTPGKGQEIGESYLFLQGKLLFMKHRFSEYKKMMQGDEVDRILLHHYLQSFYRDAGDAFLDSVILEVVNFVDKKGAEARGNLSLYSFMTYMNNEKLEEKIFAIEDKANPIRRRRHAFVAHWGRAATVEGRATPIYMDDVDVTIDLIVEAMEYVGKKLLGLNYFADSFGSFNSWNLIVPGGVEHVIADLKHYEWLYHKYKAYMTNGDPFLSPMSLHIFNQDEKGENERREQRERILALIDT